MLHLKRIFANLFGDFATGITGSRRLYCSTGMELCFEVYLFTIEVPFILGARGYYRFNQHDVYKRPYGFDFIFGIGTDMLDMLKRKKYAL